MGLSVKPTCPISFIAKAFIGHRSFQVIVSAGLVVWSLANLRTTTPGDGPWLVLAHTSPKMCTAQIHGEPASTVGMRATGVYSPTRGGPTRGVSVRVTEGGHRSVGSLRRVGYP